MELLKKSVLGGFMIGVGGVAFLACDNKYIGALLFATGLFTIVMFGLKLYTGAVAYFPNKELPFIWLGNLFGACLVGVALLFTRYSNLAEKAKAMVNIKLSDNLLSIFILSCFCGVLMYIAVDLFKKKGVILGVFLAVPTFILCGFEHCVANMFYFTVAQAWSFKALIYMLIMTLGNSIGGILMYRLSKSKEK